GSVRALSFSPDGQLLAVGGDHRKLQVLESRTLKGVRPPLNEDTVAVGLAFSSDGRRIFTVSHNTLCIWNWRESKLIDQRPVHVWLRAEFSPDGRILGTGDEHGAVEFYDLSAGGAREVPGVHSSGIHAVAWSPDGRWFASGGFDQVACVTDA